jgi:protoheme IX farnesyltransferase
MSEIDLTPAAMTCLAEASESPRRWVDYYELTKPRMNFLIVVTTMVGFYMAARVGADWHRLPAALIGTALTAAAAAIFNQIVERELDALMPRTRNRPLAAGRISPTEATGMGLAFGVTGLATLALLVNPLTAALGAFTLLSYVLIYTPLKRKTTLNTVIGAVPGAIPPVMGWTAVRGSIDAEAMALFAILFVWQMPHFLAIATMYKADYALAGFKMLPVVEDNRGMTGRMIVLYAAALVPVTLTPALLGMAGGVYVVCALVLGIAFLTFGFASAESNTRRDARKLFFASIIYLPVLLGVLMASRI